MAQTHGTCDPKFQRVRELFQGFLDSGDEIGASVAVNIGGQDVVNLWGGHSDANRTAPWNEDTIVAVFSATKNVTSLAMLMLVDEKLISIYDKVSKYWPEFAANNKEDIAVRHLLSHTSGLAGWDDPMTLEDLCNTEEATAKLARQAPWWTPGTGSGYHNLTFGYLVGELVLRVTGMHLKDFVAKRIAEPLKADFQIGVAEKDWSRVSDIIPSPPPNLPAPSPDSVAGKIRKPALGLDDYYSAMWKRAEIGAANGYCNAYGLVRIFSNVVAAEKCYNGNQLLTKETAGLIFREQSNGVDMGLESLVRFGVGYGLRGDDNSMFGGWLPGGKICGWPGYGGSIVLMDFDRQVTIGYTKNKLELEGISRIAKAYVKAVYGAMGVEVGPSDATS